MRRSALALLVAAAACGPTSPARVNMQAMAGGFRAEPLADAPNRWRVITSNGWDLGYDGAIREQRLALIRTALRCERMTVLREEERRGGAGAPFWREPITYIIDVEC